MAADSYEPAGLGGSRYTFGGHPVRCMVQSADKQAVIARRATPDVAIPEGFEDPDGDCHGASPLAMTLLSGLNHRVFHF